MSFSALTHLAVFFYLSGIALAAAGRVALTRHERVLEKLATASALAGAALHLLALFSLGMERGRFPAASTDESLLLISFFAAALALALRFGYGMRRAAMLLLPLASALALLPLHIPFPEERQAAATFSNPLFAAHTVLVMLAAALLLGHVLMSGLYIWQEFTLKRRRVMLSAMPGASLDACDRIGTRLLGWGFLCLTFGILSGALWAAQARGNFFAWKLPEIFALLTWLIFGFLLEMRLTRGWRGRAAALWSLTGLATLAAVFIGIRLT